MCIEKKCEAFLVGFGGLVVTLFGADHVFDHVHSGAADHARELAKNKDPELLERILVFTVLHDDSSDHLAKVEGKTTERVGEASLGQHPGEEVGHGDGEAAL